MLKNYIKVALRNFVKFKEFAFINVVGLAVGIACFAFISLYINHELSYDSFYRNPDRIFRLVSDMQLGGAKQPVAYASYPAARAIHSEFPEVEAIGRFFNPAIIFGAPVFRHEDNLFSESQFYFADSSVLTIFGFDYIEGSADNAFENTNGIIVTQSTARKYFGDEPALGKELTTSFADAEETFKITGVIADLPENTQLDFDMLAPMPKVEALLPIIVDAWNSPLFLTYILLQTESSPEDFQNKLALISGKYIGDTYFKRDYLLEPLERVHLYSKRTGGFKPAGDITYIYAFSAIAFFVLVLACINFLNLTTARSTRRAAEVGLRKVLGAHKIQLARQFFGESFLLVVISLAAAWGIFEFFLPVFNTISGTSLGLDQLALWQVLLFTSATLLMVGLLAGAYPAMFLARFQPIVVLKGRFSSTGSPGLRKVLVVFQFALSAGLIICTAIVQSQLDFFSSKGLGFSKEFLLVLPVGPRPSNERMEAIKTELKRNEKITAVAASYGVPGQGIVGTDYWLEGSQPKQYNNHTTLFVDEDFLAAYEIPIRAGRAFSQTFSTDKEQAFIINRAAAQQFGWRDPIGKKIRYMQPGQEGYEVIKEGEVIGVTEDFHTANLHLSITPVIMHMARNWGEVNSISIRIKAEDIDKTLAYVESTIASFAPDWPFSYFFLDENIESQYQSEQKLREIFTYFSGLAIIIACLGLFGLSAFSTEQRTKEIGVRKVLGASIENVVLHLARDFVLLVAAGFALAVPIAYICMKAWLENFAYPVGIDPLIFVIAAFVCLGIASITVSYQSIRAALRNPVDVLKYE